MAADIVAGKIVAVHADRNNRVHRFPPSLGLLIYEGVPSKEATTVLRCVAERNAIPYRVKVRGCLPSAWCCCVDTRRAGCAGNVEVLNTVGDCVGGEGGK